MVNGKWQTVNDGVASQPMYNKDRRRLSSIQHSSFI